MEDKANILEFNKPFINHVDEIGFLESVATKAANAA
jgi:hypothetical protein